MQTRQYGWPAGRLLGGSQRGLTTELSPLPIGKRTDEHPTGQPRRIPSPPLGPRLIGQSSTLHASLFGPQSTWLLLRRSSQQRMRHSARQLSKRHPDLSAEPFPEPSPGRGGQFYPTGLKSYNWNNLSPRTQTSSITQSCRIPAQQPRKQGPSIAVHDLPDSFYCHCPAPFIYCP
jgi:hypothetical protein